MATRGRVDLPGGTALRGRRERRYDGLAVCGDVVAGVGVDRVGTRPAQDRVAGGPVECVDDVRAVAAGEAVLSRPACEVIADAPPGEVVVAGTAVDVEATSTFEMPPA